MKDLENIKSTICPECGSGMKSETREGLHTNGYWREFRTFECGKRLEFSPNFLCVVDHYRCTRAKKHLEALKRQAAFKSKVLELASKNLTKEEYKQFSDCIGYLWL